MNIKYGRIPNVAITLIPNLLFYLRFLILMFVKK